MDESRQVFSPYSTRSRGSLYRIHLDLARPLGSRSRIAPGLFSEPAIFLSILLGRLVPHTSHRALRFLICELDRHRNRIPPRTR